MTEEPVETRARELFGRTASGDPAALGELYDLLAARLHGYARTLAPTEADADEALQEAFLGLARNRKNLGAVESPLAYVFRSVRNAAIAVRSTGARAASLEAASEPLLEAAEPGVLAEETDEANALLAALPDEQREVVVLKVWGELTFKEIAGLLEISQNTAASRWRYALERLRAQRGEP
ncbi:sigma-70 family RNA polymerase sigma factor [bacterium]|nr:sigma-70 family RNA polymerase sigma factor [bacterium]